MAVRRADRATAGTADVDIVLRGPAGPAGDGVPPGGSTAQVLRKASGADYDTEWATVTGGSGGGSTVTLDADGTLVVDGTTVELATDAQLTAGLADKADAAATTAALAGKANATHTHAQFDVTGLSTALAAKADMASLGDAALLDVGTTTGTVAAGNDSRLSDARTPTAHAASHASAGSDPVTVTQSQVTGLSTALAGKSDTGHAHAASDVTSGVFPISRLATGTPNGTKFIRDDGTLAVPAGGGGTAVAGFSRPQYVVGEYFSSPTPAASWAGGEVGRLTFQPLWIYEGMTVDQIGVRTNNFAAGALIRLGIYANDPAAPRGFGPAVAAPLHSAGTADCGTSAGYKYLTTSYTFPSAGLYWAASLEEVAAVQVFCSSWTSASVGTYLLSQRFQDTILRSDISSLAFVVSISGVTTGSLPSSFSYSVSNYTGGGTTPVRIALRRSA